MFFSRNKGKWLGSVPMQGLPKLAVHFWSSQAAACDSRSILLPYHCKWSFMTCSTCRSSQTLNLILTQTTYRRKRSLVAPGNVLYDKLGWAFSDAIEQLTSFKTEPHHNKIVIRNLINSLLLSFSQIVVYIDDWTGRLESSIGNCMQLLKQSHVQLQFWTSYRRVSLLSNLSP